MLMLAWILVLLVISLVSGDIDRTRSYGFPGQIRSSHLLPRNADLLTVYQAAESPLNNLLPRTAMPTRSPPPKIENLSLSGAKDDPRRQAGPSRKKLSASGVRASSAIPIPGRSSSRKIQDKAANSPDKGKGGGRQRIEQSHSGDSTSTSIQPNQQRQHGGQRVTRIETAQANIAREPAHSLRDSSGPHQPSARPNAASAADTPDEPPEGRIRDINLQTLRSHHKTWIASMTTDLWKAQTNARRRAAAGVFDMRAPPHIQKDLNAARAKAKKSRDNAKVRIEAAAHALYSRPVSSPNTRLKMGEAGWASKLAVDDVQDYYNREKSASVVAAGHSRWRHFPVHVKKYARAVSRGSAMESHHTAVIAEYQSKLDREVVSNMKKDDPGREKAVKTAVESAMDFKAAAKLYYLRDEQYRQIRQQFAEGDSSEDESMSFASVPRDGS